MTQFVLLQAVREKLPGRLETLRCLSQKGHLYQQHDMKRGVRQCFTVGLWCGLENGQRALPKERHSVFLRTNQKFSRSYLAYEKSVPGTAQTRNKPASPRKQ